MSKRNKRKETEETQETDKTEKRVRTNDSTTVEGILFFFLLKKNKHIITLNFTICKVNKKSLEKVINQVMRIETKLDILIERQKNLENRIENLEKSLNNNTNSDTDPNYVKVINI